MKRLLPFLHMVKSHSAPRGKSSIPCDLKYLKEYYFFRLIDVKHCIDHDLPDGGAHRHHHQAGVYNVVSLDEGFFVAALLVSFF